MAELILFKASPAWDLPSHSAASLQAETYARLADIHITAESRSSAGASPSDQLPALQDEQGLQLPVLENDYDDFEAARSVIEALRLRQDLDSGLNASQSAQCSAFTALIRLHLEPASVWTQWGEPLSFNNHMKAVIGADLPFPLGFFSGFAQQRRALKRIPNPDPEKIYAEAAACYKAIAGHLEAGGKSFLLGDKPSSVDAYLYGHLCLHLRAPTSMPQLRDAVEGQSVLKKYAENIARRFGTPLPPPPKQTPEWTNRRSQPASNGRRSQVTLSQAEKERRRKNWYWLAGVGTALAAYVLFSGVIEFTIDEEDGNEE